MHRPDYDMRRLLAWGVLIAMLGSGCTTTLRNQQLEQVAKDWALVIRASQVIPVYPLTEDLQPGDVLLVSTPIEEQVVLYRQKGFLPLDQHLVRLYPSEYGRFYNLRYGVTNGAIPPAPWQVLDGAGGHQWRLAPRAAFPTYRFSVSSGSGLNLAIPIQGVPLALSLMQAGNANGTVTIGDTFTYGLDQVHLVSLVRTWADRNRSVLRDYAGRTGRAHFLRVISRVYLTGQVSVTVNNEDVAAGSARGGADRPVDLPGENRSPAQDRDALEAMNRALAGELPGGKIRLASASSRSVTLSETFPRPLVIGYVGFDLPILDGGRLGPAISTRAQLTAERTVPVETQPTVYRLASFSYLYRALKDTPGAEAAELRRELDALAQKLPDVYPFSLYEFSAPGTLQQDPEAARGTPVNRRGFQDVLDFLGLARTTTTTLTAYLKSAPRDTPDEHRRADQLEEERRAAMAASENMTRIISAEPAVARALDAVFLEAP
jgi:hypothetical protein